MSEKNLMLPGNPRYQPKSLQEYFGYDNLYRNVGRVEIANLKVMAEIGLMPQETAELLTSEVVKNILALTTTQIEETERRVTKHDIRAWVHEASKLVSPELARWLHVMLTSYDALDTARTLQFLQAHYQVVQPAVVRVMRILVGLVRTHADTLQVGRTHGQHALPITVGFWLATLLYRIFYNYQKMQLHASELVGKISGAVGACNAQVGLGALEKCGALSYEERVLEKLGLKPAPISTQILPPDPLAYYLYSCAMLSASLAQLGRDCRNLMRTEINEVAEKFVPGQSGSSTMAHKRNPVNFENLEGMWIRTKNEFGKVMDTLMSEHQRDLTGSSVARDFPTIIVNLVQQLNTLLREDQGATFLENLSFNKEACVQNFGLSRHVLLSEPLYIAIQMAGYTGDGHDLVNHTLVPRAQLSGKLLAEVATEYAQESTVFAEAWNNIPADVVALLYKPELYTGLAVRKALQIAALVTKKLD